MNTIMIVEDDMKIAELLGAHIKNMDTKVLL